MAIQRGDLAFNCLGASQADNLANDDAQKNSFFGLCDAHSLPARPRSRFSNFSAEISSHLQELGLHPVVGRESGSWRGTYKFQFFLDKYKQPT